MKALIQPLRCFIQQKQPIPIRQLCAVSPLPPAKQDKFGGVTLDIGQLTADRHCSPQSEAFDEQLKGWLKVWRNTGVRAAWLRIPIEQGGHMAVAGKYGFTFHHAEGSHGMLCQWLDSSESRLPQFATHQVGCSGCVLREDSGEVLVVRDRHNPFSTWKFPGGLSELGEDIGDTAVREVFEETGVKSEFSGVMMMRQQHTHPGAFGRSDMFFVTLLRPLTFDLCPDPREITDCTWMDINELAASAQKSAITVRAVNMVKHGLKHGFDKITMDIAQCKSVYKGMFFKVYNPRVEGLNEGGDSAYMHSLGDTSLLNDVKKQD